MVLIKWRNSDDENKDEDQNQPTSIRSVQSSWQPSQNNSAITGQSSNIFAQTPSQQDNYLMSEQKSAIDEEKRRKEAEAAAQAEIARQSVPQQTITYTQQEGQPAQPVDETGMETAKNDTGWKKYYDEELNKQKSGMNFFDRLLDAGQASKRAETLARVRYNSDILNQAYDTSGNTINQAAADQARNLAAYNQSQSTQNSAESLARTRAIGATPDTKPNNFWDTVGNVINAEKNASIYDAIMGVDDSQNFSINDAARFVGGLGQGIFTAPVIGAKELYEAGTGTGTDEQTGYQKELSGGERLGRGIAGALGVVTPFVGGSGKLLEGAFMSNAEKAAINAVKEGTATQAERLLAMNALRPTVAKGLVYPTLEQSAIGAAQTGAEYFGQGNNIVDENGNIDPEKFAELAKQVGESAAMNIVGGAALAGAGMGLRRLRDRGEVLPENIPQRDKQLDVTPITESRTNIPELGMTPINRLSDSNITPIADRTNIVDRTPVQENIPMIDRADIPFRQEITNEEIAPTQLRTMDIAEPNVTTDMATIQPKPTTNLADGTVTPVLEPAIPRENIPTLSSEVKALQDAKLGSTQAEEAAINQELQNIQDNVPSMDTTDTTVDQDLAGRVVSRLDEPKEYIRQVANMLDNSGTNIAENMGDTLSMFGGKGNQALKNRISDKYDNLRQKVAEYNVLQNQNLSNLTGDGVSAIDSDISRQRSSIQNQIGLIQKDLEGDITRLAMQISGKERAKQIYNNLNRYRKSNILFGAPSIERNMTQDLLGTIVDVFKNPNLMRSTILKMPESYASSIKSSLREWTIPPKVVSDIPRYVVGNLYNSAMSLVGVEGLIRSRKAGYRDVIARNVLEKLGEPATSANIKKIAGVMGNEAETLANTAAGVANFMTSNTQFKRAADNYFKYLETGDPVARQNFLDNVERQSTITSQLTQNLKMGNSPVGHIAAAALDFISPFVRTATNAVDTAFTGTLNPKSMSPADYLLKDIRSGKHNFGSIIKNKTIDAATLMGISGLVSAGIISFNNGDEIDKPQGISIKVGENQYIPIRATNIELPIALVYTATQIMNDVDNGNIGTDKIPEYINIIDGSLPYVESIAQSKESLESLMGTNNDGQGDNGYAAKAFGINAAKSFVPFSNNSLQPFIAGKQGQSLNTKSTYDSNMGTWFGNTMVKSYPMVDQEAYNRLKDSRDAAGRVRTVDNQGVFINKTINDANTAKYNNTIDDLVAYGKESKLGSGVKDMFNTYDTGKNNSFKSIQDTITFLDSNGAPDNAKKLESNAKLSNLSQQIRNGFFGDTSAELLTLDGKNLMSDVSMPNTSGTKNTNQPISMQSIVNSIAQTDLSEDQRNKMYAISQQDSDLWNQYKNKSITYNQYAAARQATGQAYRDVLSSSENYQKLSNLMTKLDSSGFFADGGLGSTRSGQTYLWNALNSLLGSKGKTPAAAYPESSSKYSPYSRSGYSRRSGGSSGSGFNATNKPSDTGTTGIKWTPVKATQMATSQTSKYIPFNIKVKLGSQVKKNKTQDYSDRSF